MEKTQSIRRLDGTQLINLEKVEVFRHEMGFFLDPEGPVQTLLPGEHSVAGTRPALCFIALGRSLVLSGAAGIGGLPVPGGARLGCWADYQCTLLSARRFLARHQETLLLGQSIGECLQKDVRGALRTALSRAMMAAGKEVPEAALWQAAEMYLAPVLLEGGWQLSAFQPRHMHRA